MRKILSFLSMAATLLAIVFFGVPSIVDNPQLGFEFDGGYEIVYEIKDQNGISSKQTSKDAAEVLAARVGFAGINDPELRVEGENDEFVRVAKTLEKHYKDMQDMEFTIEKGKLYMLQTRNGKRTAQAALKIAIDLVNEGLITEQEAVLMVEPKSLDALLHPGFDQKALKQATPITKGLNASPGAACGKVVFTAERAKELNAQGEKVVLVRLETSPEDIEGMIASQGILTARGGMTSHAAVVARGMGTCCVSGAGEVLVNEEEKYFTVKGKRYNELDWISIDGNTGYVYGEAIPTVEASVTGDFATLMAWADKYR